jgi:hypothetical protein
MLSELRYEWSLRRLQRSKQKLLQAYASKRVALPKGPERVEARQRLINDEQMDLEEANEEISYLTTTHLVREAERLIVPLPPSEETYWHFNETFGRRHLTTEGVIKLRTDIRAERKARRELPMSLLPMAIGLIGALTGLLSIVFKH